MLDTSRIESGTFSYTFSDLDIGEIVRESAAAAESSQDEVAVRADVPLRFRPFAATASDSGRWSRT